MLMIDSIECDIRHTFSDVKAEVPCFANDKANEKSFACQVIKPLLLLARRKISLGLMKKNLLNW